VLAAFDSECSVLVAAIESRETSQRIRDSDNLAESGLDTWIPDWRLVFLARIIVEFYVAFFDFTFEVVFGS
jgi:tripartite-type tricarboxylate transporter receptor subunit TctC